MRKLWLVFAQAVTITLAVAFVTGTLRPDLLGSLGRGSNVVTIREAGRPAAPAVGSAGTYRLAAEKASAAVVNVYTTKDVRTPRHPLMKDPFFRRFFGEPPDEEPQRSSSLGSGVIVGTSGFILTNHHVIESADGIEIALSDGRKLAAKVVGADPETDLAVLKVAVSDLPAMTFAQPDAIGVGDVVLAIGNPFGVGQTVTMGIVSGLGRSHVGLSTFENYIQTDAAINPGNSGGALVDTSGNLVGINTAIYSRNGSSMGIGFAIPVSLAKEVMDQIIATGTVTRGWIGVEMQELTPELAESFKLESTDGTLIAGVIHDSPAEQAGIRPGDILTAIEGKHVTDSSSMLHLIAALQPGKRAAVTVMRNGKALQISVLVGKRPLQIRAQPEE
jgi:serine protease DegQ